MPKIRSGSSLHMRWCRIGRGASQPGAAPGCDPRYGARFTAAATAVSRCAGSMSCSPEAEPIFWACLIVRAVPLRRLSAPVLPCCAAFRPPVRTRQRSPRALTIVISAYNEASHIEATVRNKLEQDYPADLLRRHGGLRRFDRRHRRQLLAAARTAGSARWPSSGRNRAAGKTAALNRLVERARR